MEATLCLRPRHALVPAPARKLHCRLTVSTSSNIALRASPPPPADAGISTARIQRCSKLRCGGFAHAMPLGWPMGRRWAPTRASSSSNGGPGDGKNIIEKSIDVLQKIVKREDRDGVIKFLKEQLGDERNKKYPNLLGISQKGKEEANLLLKEWEKEIKTKRGEEEYMLGLVLMDVFMHKGGTKNLKKADSICKKMEEIAIPSDTRFPLRKDIIKMLEVEDILSIYGSRHVFLKYCKKEVEDLKIIVVEVMLKKIKEAEETSNQFPTIPQEDE